MTIPVATRSVVWHPAYEVDIGPHVFPTQKYRLIRRRLLDDGTIEESNLLTPDPAGNEDVLLAHEAEFVDKITKGTLSPQEQMVLEIPLSGALREAMWLCAGGTTLTGLRALEDGAAAHLGGGFHHAFPDHGEGFCLINDVAIATRVLLSNGRVGRVAIIDLDVHQGNGTAAIFAGDEAVFTFSMHQENSYPVWKPPSDLDVGLDDHTGDEEYLSALERSMPRILDHRPDLVFYLAGADPYREDQLGGLSLTLEGLHRRDDYVLETLTRHEIAAAVTLAGGYAMNPDDTVEIHCNTVRATLRARPNPAA